MKKPLAPVIGTINPNGGGSDQALQLAKMPWYPRDFASATRGWPLTARGLYRELLDAQWDMQRLPEEPSRLRSIAGATPAEWKAAWTWVEPKFPIVSDGYRQNMRLEAHRVKAAKIRRQQQAGAAATNEALGRTH